MTARRNFVAFVCGKRGSGKSFLLNRLAQPFPRRLILDFLGEYEGVIRGAREAWDIADTVDALRDVARSPRWTVVSSMDESEVPALLEALAPARHGGALGFSRAVGGMLLQSDEIDTVLPNGGGATEARNIFKRGRHHGLSILCGTQRPAETARIVTSQSDIICSFRQHEPRDVAYLSGVMGGSHVAPLLYSLADRWHLRYWVNTGALELVDPDGRARPATPGQV